MAEPDSFFVEDLADELKERISKIRDVWKLGITINNISLGFSPESLESLIDHVTEQTKDILVRAYGLALASGKTRIDLAIMNHAAHIVMMKGQVTVSNESVTCPQGHVESE